MLFLLNVKHKIMIGLTTYILTPVTALVLTLIFVPVTKKIALKVNLVDKPNARKVHSNPVPLVGGISIFIASFLTLAVSNHSWSNIGEIKVILSGALILLLIGIIDDKMDIRASFKLIIQIALSYFAFMNGLKIVSLYGVFGIYELPLTIQYILTLTIITGVVNAFNLMDGIDGLAAGLAIVGLSAFTYLAFLTDNSFLSVLYLALIGSLTGFLHFNFSKKNKIFMGDAGSLFLGFILVVSAISMIQSAKGTSDINMILPIVIGVLALPVIDSLRVYRRRIKNGYSPFRADRTHFHHLVLLLGLQHKFSSIIIIAVSGLIIMLSIVFGSLLGITFTILAILLIFAVITALLGIYKDVNIWREKIRQLEEC